MPTVDRAARTDSGLAAQLRQSVMRLRRRLASEHDPANSLSMSSMLVLGSLYRSGELTVGELAAIERVQPPSMTRRVSALEEQGLVVRRADETDRRVVRVDLTDAGRERVVADRRLRDEWLARRLRELTAEERAVLRAAVPLLHRLAEEA